MSKLLAFVLAALCALQAPAGQDTEDQRILVRFKPGRSMSLSRSQFGMQLLKQVGMQEERSLVYRVNSGISLQSALEKLESMPGVASAFADHRVRVLDVTPSDSLYLSQWHLRTSKAASAWAVTTGSSQVKVCIIDTGAQRDHPDLAPNIVKGFSAIAGEDPNDCSDGHGHGTHVAGIVAAVGNNAAGVAGMAWNASLVICRFMDDSGSGWTSDAVDCMDKCRQEGALITTHSYGGYSYSNYVKKAFEAGAGTGEEFMACAAAGNENFNADQTPMYPAGYDVPNIISVGASTSSDNKASYSNYGATSVDLFAPGSSILATVINSGYGYKSGTSMAAPVVAGAAALLQAAAQARGVTLTAAQMKQYLMAGVDKPAQLAGLSVSGGRLNINASMNMLVGDLESSRSSSPQPPSPSLPLPSPSPPPPSPPPPSPSPPPPSPPPPSPSPPPPPPSPSQPPPSPPPPSPSPPPPSPPPPSPSPPPPSPPPPSPSPPPPSPPPPSPSTPPPSPPPPSPSPPPLPPSPPPPPPPAPSQPPNNGPQVQTYTIRQRSVLAVSYGCARWKRQDANAYSKRVRRLSNVRRVLLRCKKASRRKLQVTIAVKTTSITLQQKNALTQRLAALSKKRMFRKALRRVQ